MDGTLLPISTLYSGTYHTIIQIHTDRNCRQVYDGFKSDIVQTCLVQTKREVCMIQIMWCTYRKSL